MTRQEAFELAVNGIVNQNGFGVVPGTSACVYHNPSNGNRCAIGHIVSEDKAKHLFEMGYGQVAKVPRSHLPEGIREDVRFLSALQGLHDNCSFDRRIPAFIEAAVKFGRVHDLDVTFITERK